MNNKELTNQELADMMIINFAKTLPVNMFIQFFLSICNESLIDKTLVDDMLDICCKKSGLISGTCVLWMILCGTITNIAQELKLGEFINSFYDETIDNEMFVNILNRIKNKELDSNYFRKLLKYSSEHCQFNLNN